MHCLESPVYLLFGETHFAKETFEDRGHSTCCRFEEGKNKMPALKLAGFNDVGMGSTLQAFQSNSHSFKNYGHAIVRQIFR